MQKKPLSSSFLTCRLLSRHTVSKYHSHNGTYSHIRSGTFQPRQHKIKPNTNNNDDNIYVLIVPWSHLLDCTPYYTVGFSDVWQSKHFYIAFDVRAQCVSVTVVLSLVLFTHFFLLFNIFCSIYLLFITNYYTLNTDCFTQISFIAQYKPQTNRMTLLWCVLLLLLLLLRLKQNMCTCFIFIRHFLFQIAIFHVSFEQFKHKRSSFRLSTFILFYLQRRMKK